MRDTASFTRSTVATALGLCGLMTVVSVLLMPDFSGDVTDRLRAIGADPAGATASALLFTGSQLPFVVGLAGVAHLLRDRAPRLATTGGLLAVVGGFGHAVYGGVSMIMLQMADDLDNVTVHAGVLAGAESGPGVAFMAMGLLGTVLGLVLIGVGLWRAQLGPRWLGPALIAFVAVEFIGAGLSQWAGYASGVLYLVSFSVLALTVARTPAAAWATPTALSRQDEAKVVA